MAVLPTSGHPAQSPSPRRRLSPLGEKGREAHPGSPWFKTREAQSAQGIVKTEKRGTSSSCGSSSCGRPVSEPGGRQRPRPAWRSHLPPPGTQLAGPRVWDIKSTLFPMRKDMEPEFLCRAVKGRWAPGIAVKVEMEASVPLEDQLSHRPISPGPPHPSQSQGPYAEKRCGCTAAWWSLPYYRWPGAGT